MKGLVVTTSLVFFMLIASMANATIHVVNNNPGGAGDFTTAQAAHDAAAAGDTLYLVPSSTNYSTTLTKKLHFIGTGYMFATNEIPGNSNKESRLAISGDITNATSTDKNGGAAGSSFTGLTIVDNGRLDFRVNDISFVRCKIDIDFYIDFNDGDISGLSIIQCYMTNNDVFNAYSAGQDFSNLYVANTYLQGDVDEITGGTFIHCVFGSQSDIGLYCDNSSFENCVFTYAGGTSTYLFANNNSVNYSILAQATPASNTGTGNQFGVVSTGVFQGDAANSTDGQWQLSTSSPAKGAGSSGVDIGMFGGANPYVLSGLPAFPRVTSFIAPPAGSSTTGLPVQITIESKN